MPPTVGGGNGRSDRRSVKCVLLPLAVVFLLSLGVAAVPEEQHNAAVPEQPKQEVVSSSQIASPRFNESMRRCCVVKPSERS